MQNFPNIEKLPGHDYYTGYANGAIYRIYRMSDKRWRAHPVSGKGDLNTPNYFYERTMREVSATLNQIAEARIPIEEFIKR